MKKIIFKYESLENGKQEKLVKKLDLETVQIGRASCRERV